MLFIANLKPKYKKACETKAQEDEDKMEQILKDNKGYFKENKTYFEERDIEVSESDEDEEDSENIEETK